MPACALPGKKRRRRITLPAISARLGGHITLEATADGGIAACFDGYSVGLGKFSSGVAERAQELRTGLPLASFAGRRAGDKEVDLLVRRLAQSGLLEFRFGQARANKDQVVIEPQVRDYWPRTPKLGNKDVIALSRFAYLRRRGNEMVLESPRAGALFRICDPKIAAALASLSTPQKNQRAPAGTRLSRIGASRAAGRLPDPFQDRNRQRRWSATVRGRRQPRALGFSRSSVPHAQYGGTAGQPARRTLSICGSDPSATGGAAALAR